MQRPRASASTRTVFYLEGLTSLSDAAAESLSKHKGTFYLKSKNLSKSAADILRLSPSFRDVTG